MFAAYRVEFLDLATEIDQMQRRELPKEWLPVFPTNPKGVAGREASNSLAARTAIVNGLSLFFSSDYARLAIRLSTLMELPTIFVFTHQAMGDGEDGPTQ